MAIGDISSLIDSKKMKPIRTDNLILEGYLLMWKNAMIDVDNISMVTASDLPVPAFPGFSLLTFLAGVALYLGFGEESIGVLLLLAGAGWFGLWCYQAYSVAGHKCLNLFLNSGYTYSIIFNNDAFLEEVLTTLIMVFKEGINENTLYTFNIGNCTINGSLVRN